MTIVDLLQQIGLNKYEAEAYYTLLTHAPLTGYEVGKYSHVPGSRSYEILERLLEKGLALLQPGDPPRYTAQEPDVVFDRFRSTMETTLNTLATSLASLAHTNKMDEFWVVRGLQNVLVQAKAMIAHARTTLDLVLPAHCDLAESLVQAAARGCCIFHTLPEDQNSQAILLVCDSCEALVGMLTPIDSCQAVVSSNAALLDALHGYFQHRQSPAQIMAEASTGPAQLRNIDWLDWEARKQRHLHSVSIENRVA
jgi:sugar-specific transcriptional regulator TrmB